MSPRTTAVYFALFAVPAFVVSVLGTRWLIGALKRRQFGKSIREDGPRHEGKAGTPTMGGLVVVAVILLGIAAVLFVSRQLFGTYFDPAVNGFSQAVQDDARLVLATLRRAMAATAAATLAFGTIGLLDDWQGLARKGRARAVGIGLSARRLLALQAAAAVIVALILAPIAEPPAFANTGLDVQVPGHAASYALLNALTWVPGSVSAGIGDLGWVVVASVVLVAMVNGVNLSDGLDGLAGGVAAIAFVALGFCLIAWRLISQQTWWAWHLNFFHALLCFAVAGACVGFLVHNRYPARVFMGNVTSMALGGALATIALATGTWLLLPVIGIVYVAEVLSDIIQVGYFKWTGGKRFFRMAPIHHHFELLGMHETAVTRRFWLAGAAGGALAVGFVFWATWGIAG